MALIIQDELIAPYEISIDDMNVTLFENTVVQSGKTKGEVLKAVVGYYSSLDGLMAAIVRGKINLSEKQLYSLKEYAKEYSELFKQTNKLLRERIRVTANDVFVKDGKQ